MFGMADLSFELFSDLEIADPPARWLPGSSRATHSSR
jgi:hypothetical protein